MMSTRRFFRIATNQAPSSRNLAGSFLFAWTTFVVVMLVMPVSADNRLAGVPGLDKLVHASIFFIWSWLTCARLEAEPGVPVFFKVYSAVIGSGLFAFLLEYYQNFLPTRAASFSDFIFGWLGGSLAVAVFNLVKRHSKPKLLLHICCIGCGVFVSRELSDEFEVVLYFFNPNIFPQGEYDKRLDEIKKVAAVDDRRIIIDKYDHPAWLEEVSGLESEPEKGKRCAVCFACRLSSAARMAKREGFDFFATTLSISPHKDEKLISEIGYRMSERFRVSFLDRDFKKDGGYRRSTELSRELGLYRQNYCGCEFSIRPIRDCC